jgi:hypothetical protein
MRIGETYRCRFLLTDSTWVDPLGADASFPDQTGKPIRCTSYGQALYSLPGNKLIPKEAAAWFKVFFQANATLYYSHTWNPATLKTQFPFG